MCVCCKHLIDVKDKDPYCDVNKYKPSKANKDHNCQKFETNKVEKVKKALDKEKTIGNMIKVEKPKIEINDPAIVHISSKIPVERQQKARMARKAKRAKK